VAGRRAAVWASAMAMVLLAAAWGGETGGDLACHFFYSPTCVHCHPVRQLLGRIESEHPGFRWEGHVLTDPANIELMTRYYAEYAVPEEKWSGTIAVFYGKRWWTDGDSVLAQLEGSLGASSPRPVVDEDGKGSAAALRSAFERFSPLVVVGAGLLDGVNPCALASLIFLLSYLAASGRQRVQVLRIGLAFAAGVFLAYLAVGLGLLGAIRAVDRLSLASRLVYPALALLTLTLAVLSLADYRKACRGGERAIMLKLPRALTLANHGIIRRLPSHPAYAVAAFLIGAAVSILELFCTGQIYLPTLMYIWHSGVDKSRVLAYLILYAAMFTLPVVALTCGVYGGLSSRHLANWARERLAIAKLLTAAVFALLGTYLAVVSGQLFGVR